MGPYCDYCQRRCFLERAYPTENGWRHLFMATCDRGRQSDREKTGYDFKTAANPVTDPRFQSDAGARTERMTTLAIEALSAIDPTFRVYGGVDRGDIFMELPGCTPGIPENIFRLRIKEIQIDEENEENSST
jgi:hypothetical protein